MLLFNGSQLLMLSIVVLCYFRGVAKIFCVRGETNYDIGASVSWRPEDICTPLPLLTYASVAFCLLCIQFCIVHFGYFDFVLISERHLLNGKLISSLRYVNLSFKGQSTYRFFQNFDVFMYSFKKFNDSWPIVTILPRWNLNSSVTSHQSFV